MIENHLDGGPVAGFRDEHDQSEVQAALPSRAEADVALPKPDSRWRYYPADDVPTARRKAVLAAFRQLCFTAQLATERQQRLQARWSAEAARELIAAFGARIFSGPTLRRQAPNHLNKD